MSESIEAVAIKPWWKQPGEVFDSKGIPIYPADLIRSPHFIGARRKQHWLYHTAVFHHGYMELVPVHHLHSDKGGGRCLLSQEIVKGAEIIAGYGPGNTLSYSDRPKRKSNEIEDGGTK